MNDDAFTYAIAKALLVIASSTSIILYLVWVVVRSSFELPTFLRRQSHTDLEGSSERIPSSSPSAGSPISN